MMLQIARRNRLLTVILIVTLGAGIGTAAVMCNLIDILFFRPPAHVLDPKSVVRVPSVTNYVQYQQLRHELKSLDLFAYSRVRLTSGDARDATAVRVECVTENYFDVLGVTPNRGRRFLPGSGTAVDPQVAVISYNLWARLFDGGGELRSATFSLKGRTYGVIGVAPRGFRGLDREPVDVWLSLTDVPELCSFTGRNLLAAASGGWLRAGARLRAGFTIEQAETEISSHTGGRRPRLTTESMLQPVAGPKRGALSRESRVAIWSAGAALVVLVIACLNAAILMTLRSLDRRLEVAVMLQVGATRFRVFLLFLSENLVLTLLSTLAALAVVGWMGMALDRIVPSMPDGYLSGKALGIVAAFSVVSSLFSGVIPAIQIARSSASAMLRSGHHVLAGHTRLRSGLVFVQLSLAQLLLVGSGVFVRSVEELMTGAGYDIDNVIVATLERNGHGQTANPWLTTPDLVDTLRRVPAVSKVGISSASLLGSGGTLVAVGIRTEPASAIASTIKMNAVTDEYFAALGTRILRGRSFSVKDSAHAKPVGIVDQGYASANWPGVDPIGKCIYLGTSRQCIEVIGVSEVRRPGLLIASEEEFFVPAAQVDQYDLHQEPQTLFIRVDRDVERVMPMVVSALQRAVPELPASNVRPLADLADAQTVSWRLGALTFRLYGALAALMAAAGLYGALALTVQQRTADLAMRMVLGATPVRIIGMFSRHVLILFGAAWLIGTIGAVQLRTVFGRLLFGASTTDMDVQLRVTLFMCVVVILGCLLPLMRAIRLSPSSALRHG
jgi:predicted permease